MLPFFVARQGGGGSSVQVPDAREVGPRTWYRAVFVHPPAGGSVGGNVDVHGRHMHSTALRPMTLLDNDWGAICHSPPSRTAFERLVTAEPLVGEVCARDLGDLVEHLRVRPRAGMAHADSPDEAPRGGDPNRPAAVVRAMLRSAKVHPLVARAIVQALAPGLVTVARRLSWGAGGEWPDGGAFLVDAMATLWEVVSEWAGDDRQYAVLDLLSAVRCRLRRRLLHHRRDQDLLRSEPLVDSDARAGGWESSSTDLDQLAAAIDRTWDQDLEHRDAAVLYAHRVLGYSLSELSAITGRSRRYLGARRDRAAQALTA